MGSAVYYLKAIFPAGVNVEKIRNDAEKLLKDVARFADRWQEVRCQQGTPADRAAKLKAEFPHVWEAMHLDELVIESGDQPLNAFSGELCINEDMSLTCDETTIYLSDEVWHFADWTRFENYFKSLGAIKVGYVSDEYLQTDPFDHIQL